MHMICLLLLLMVQGGDGKSPVTLRKAVPIGQEKEWYKKAPEAATAWEKECVFDYNVGTGTISATGKIPLYRLAWMEEAKIISLPVYAPEAVESLSQLVGYRVLAKGKLVKKPEGETPREEIWLGELTPLELAPSQVFTEPKILARTNQMTMGGMRTNNVGTQVFRNMTEFNQVALNQLGFSDPREATNYIFRNFGRNIDWKKEMILSICYFPNRNTGAVETVEISRILVNEKGTTVFWKSKKLPGRGGSPISSDSVIIQQLAGEIKFVREETKEGEEKKDETKPGEKGVEVVPRK